MRAERNKVENRKARQKMNEIRSWFFVKINRIDKPLAGWTKKKKRLKSLKSEMKIWALLRILRNKKDFNSAIHNCMPTN